MASAERELGPQVAKSLFCVQRPYRAKQATKSTESSYGDTTMARSVPSIRRTIGHATTNGPTVAALCVFTIAMGVARRRVGCAATASSVSKGTDFNLGLG